MTDKSSYRAITISVSTLYYSLFHRSGVLVLESPTVCRLRVHHALIASLADMVQGIRYVPVIIAYAVEIPFRSGSDVTTVDIGLV